MIVTQKLSRPFFRLLRTANYRRWALALVLPFAGVVTAFGIAPDTIAERIEQSRVVETVTLPAAVSASVSVAGAAQTFWREERIQRGETLASLLTRLDIEDDVAVTRKGHQVLTEDAPKAPEDIEKIMRQRA